MLPVLIYDIRNGFMQTFGFIAWILYKIIKLPINFYSIGYFNNFDIIQFLLEKYKILIFANNLSIAILFLILSFTFFLYLLRKEKTVSLFLLIISLLILFLGFLINKVPSDAYLPTFFPIMIVVSAIFWDFVIKKIKLIGLMSLVIFGFLNIYYFLNYDLGSRSKEFTKRKEVAGKVLKLASKKDYNLLGKGSGSQFTSFTMNYEYLLWYYYNSRPSKNSVNLKIFVEEKNDRILVNTND